MVQLPATAAIEYVAACCTLRTRTRTRTKTKIGTITKTVRRPYARSPQVQYVYAPSGLSVPSRPVSDLPTVFSLARRQISLAFLAERVEREK